MLLTDTNTHTYIKQGGPQHIMCIVHSVSAALLYCKARAGVIEELLNRLSLWPCFTELLLSFPPDFFCLCLGLHCCLECLASLHGVSGEGLQVCCDGHLSAALGTANQAEGGCGQLCEGVHDPGDGLGWAGLAALG